MLRKLLTISLLWGLVIMVLSAIPGSSLPKPPTIPYFDKLVHLGLYFILSSFLLPVLDFSKSKNIQRSGPLVVLVIVAFYGGFIEIAQEKWFVGRSADINDFYADLAGGTLGIILYYMFIKKLIIKKVFKS